MTPARRILLAWELGEGLGHAGRLLDIAIRLKALGWQPVVAARNVEALAVRYAEAGIPVEPAPAHRNCYRGTERFRASSYADLMGACGYADLDQLASCVDQWDRVLARLSPDMVIADYAPLLSLAAFGRVPVIAVGDGFVTPHGVSGNGFPALRDPPEAPLWSVDTLLDNARRVQRARGAARPASLAAIVEGDAQIVAVPPELDIYAATRPTPAHGPWFKPEPPLAAAHDPAVFAYLRAAHPHTGHILQLFLEGALTGECYLPDSDSGVRRALASAGVRVHEHAPPLRDSLARAALLIHHGGIGSLETAALAGRPQLLLPRHLEQTLNARQALAHLPGAVLAPAGMSAADLREKLPGLPNDRRLAAAALASAHRLTSRGDTAWGALLGVLDQFHPIMRNG